jgi:hypothetical protein
METREASMLSAKAGQERPMIRERLAPGESFSISTEESFCFNQYLLCPSVSPDENNVYSFTEEKKWLKL